MNTLFINLSIRPDAKRRILPVGLGYILTAVKNAGLDFDLIDMDILNMNSLEFEGVMSKKDYDVVAMGCIASGLKYIKEIASIVKKVNKETIVIAGNSVATSMPELLLRNTKVDIAIIGEADLTIVELLQTLESRNELQKVAGIAFLDEDKLCLTNKRAVIGSLDQLAFPDWDLFDIEKYNEYAIINTNTASSERLLSYPLNSARGCPYSCTFCYHVFKGEKYRKYSEPIVMNEITRLHTKYNCNFISFWDELTFPTIISVERMIENLNTLDFSIGWEAPVRGDLLRHEHLDLVRGLKQAGCDNLSFSLENASEEILRAINKRLNVSQFIEQCEVLWEGGVTPLVSVIFGYPQETKESIQLTLDVCKKCNVFPSVGFLLPLPGTEVYQQALRSGHIEDETEYLMRIGDRQDFHINLTQMLDEELVGIVEDGLVKLANEQGLKLDSVFKTTTYQKPCREHNA